MLCILYILCVCVGAACVRACMCVCCPIKAPIPPRFKCMANNPFISKWTNTHTMHVIPSFQSKVERLRCM